MSRALTPLEKTLAEFPLKFAVAVLIAEPSRFDGDVRLTNGTATLVQFGRNRFAVTCSHVLEKYRRTPDAILQIGNIKLDPTVQLVAEHPTADLATIRISESQAEGLTACDGMRAEFFQPTSWPPATVRENHCVALCGYPGKWRQRMSPEKIDFYGYSIGATAVTSAGEDRFACLFERQRWVSSFRHELQDLEELGGMSGGPVFRLGYLQWELVGFIYEFSPQYDIMFMRSILWP